MSHIPVNNGHSNESFNKQTTLLEKQMDEPIPWDQKCKSSKELFKIKRSVGTIFDGVERYKETIAKRIYFGYIDPFIQNTIEANFCPEIRRISADLEKFHVCLKEKMVSDLRYFNSLELEVGSDLNWKLRKHNKCECLEKELSKSKMMSKSFEALQKHAINLEIHLQQCQEKIKNDNSFKENQSKEFCKECKQYFEIQDLKDQLQDKAIAINSLERKDFSKSKSVTKNNVSNDFSKPVTAQILPPNKKSILKNTNVLAPGILNANTSNVNFVCATCGKCMLNEKHDMYVLKSPNDMNSITKMLIDVPVSTREHKHIVNQSVAKPLRKTVASESTNQKPDKQLGSYMSMLQRHVVGGILSLHHQDTNGNLSLK
nr:hypothetical protein [Tanacetum cinerariifolium]